MKTKILGGLLITILVLKKKKLTNLNTLADELKTDGISYMKY